MKYFTVCRLSAQAFMKRLLVLIILISGGGNVSAQTYTVNVGTGTSTTPNVPLNSNYGYNYSQQIYTKADITAAGGLPGVIRKIRFYLTGNTAVVNSSDITVYMGNMDKADFTSNTDWVPLGSMTEVFNSIVEFPASGPGWVEISLESDFTWDGVSNIIVAIDENTPGFGSQVAWRSTINVTGLNQSIYYRNDSNNPDPANPPAATGRLAGFPNAQFEFMQIPCNGVPMPGNTIATPSVLCGSGPVTLTMDNELRQYSGIAYQWESSPDGTTDWQAISEANAFSYTTQVSTTTWFRAVLSCGSSVAATTPVSVTVHALPNVTINAADLAVCGDNAALTASGAASFAWSPASGLDMTTGPTVQASPASPTVYTVTGTDDNNCQNTAKVTVSPFGLYRPQITGIPASGCTAGVPVSITVSNPLANPDVEYELQDAEGNTVIPWQSAASFTVTPDEEGAFVYHVLARKADCETLSLPGVVRVYQGFAADVATIQDCDANSAAILISNARGAGRNEETWQNNFSDPELPPAVTLFGSAAITGGRAVITPSATSQRGALQLSGITTINPQAVTVAFKLTADQVINTFGTGGGDGLAWSFGDDADYVSGLTNGVGSKLRVVFDAADNSSSNGNTRGIYLTYGYSSNNPMGPGSAGTIAYSNDIQSWKTRTDTPVLVVIDEDNQLTLTVNEQVIFDHIPLPDEYAAADKSQWKHLFSAFTGGDALRQAITDLAITYRRQDFVYGISAGGSGTLPAAWQSSDTFAELASPGSYDVWMAPASNPSACYKLLTTTHLLHPINISSVSKTELTGCESDDGTITLNGLVANAVYQVDYVSSVSGNHSGNMTTDGAGSIVLADLAPATYSDIFVSAGSCTSAAIDPVVIAKPVKPVLLAFSSGSNTDCSVPNGSISLFSTDFVSGDTYEIWYNGASRGNLAADADKLIILSGLATGDYSDIHVVTAQHCVSNIIPLRSVTGVAAAPVITGAFAAAPSDCNSATGVIQLSGTFSEGSASVSYRRNGIPALALATASGGTLNLTGMSPGVYDSFSVASGCASNVWSEAVIVNPAGATAPASGNAFKTDVQGADVTVDYYDNGCGRIATLNSSEGSLGNVSVIVTVTGNTGVYYSQPYIGRYYDIQTGNNAGGTVTLYFTDAEISRYNTYVTTLGDPRFPAIGENGENLRITVFHSAAPGSGPEGYDPSLTESVNPTEVVRDPSGFWRVTFVTTGFSGFFAHTNRDDSPLPVRLVSFSGSPESENTVGLHWEVADQQNIASYTVEYSSNGADFEKAGTVAATQTTEARYTFRHTPLQSGKIAYYRLRISEADGTRSNSNIISVKLPGRSLASVYPVPADHGFWLEGPGISGTTASIVNIHGIVLKTWTSLSDKQYVDISSLPSGMYFVRLQDGTSMKVVKK